MFKTIYLSIRAILKYILNINKLDHFIVMVLALLLIKLWIRIALQPEFTIEDDVSADGSVDFIHSTIFLLADYRIYTSIISLILFSRLTKLFDLNSKLAKFSYIIVQAFTDILFFIIMFVVFLIGFSLVGHVLLGISISEFKDVQSSLFILFQLVAGSVDVVQLKSYNEITKNIFSLTYMAVMIVLINMFVAIIISHYVEGYIQNSKILKTSIKSKNFWTKFKNKLRIFF